MKAAFTLAAVSVVSAVNMDREPLLTWSPTPPASIKMNYFVPHFGEDTEIKASKKNVADAEKALGHVLDTSAPPDDPPKNYFVPHFGTDEDIKSSMKNLADQEKLHGAWNYPADEWF